MTSHLFNPQIPSRLSEIDILPPAPLTAMHTSIPEYDPLSTLVVVLVELSAQEFQSLQSALKDIASILYCTPRRAMLDSITVVPEHYDSQAVIYAISVSAARIGWEKLLVVDGLSRRYLTGDLLIGEEHAFPFVAIQLIAERTSDHTGSQDELVVIAKRVRSENITEVLTADQVIPDTEPLPWYEPRITHFISCQQEIILHDPESPMFSTDHRNSTGHEILLQSMLRAFEGTTLPQEIRADIVQKAILSDCGAMKFKDPSTRKFTIYALFPMSKEELWATKAAICKDLEAEPNPKRWYTRVKLVPWPKSKKATRRCFMDLYDYFRGTEPFLGSDLFCLYFLDRPYERMRHIGYAQGIHAMPMEPCTHDIPACISRATLGELKEMDTRLSMRKPSYWNFFIELLYEESLGRELMFHPDSPFYLNYPIWLPRIHGWPVPPVFFLTKHLASFELAKLRHDLKELDSTNPERQYCYVPWDREDDGTVDDIWDILYKTSTTIVSGRNVEKIILVDRMSAEDGNVIVAALAYRYRKLKVKSKSRIAELLNKWGIIYTREAATKVGNMRDFAKYKVRQPCEEYKRQDDPDDQAT